MRKKKVIRALILAAIFVVAIVVISYITNKGNTDTTADMGGASLPRVAFQVEERLINELAGYAVEMDITSVRNTVTPLAQDGSLAVKIEKYDNVIKKLSYEVLTLDGKTSLLKGSTDKIEDIIMLPLGDALKDTEEAVLKLTVEMGKEKKVYFYTRIMKAEGLNTKACFDFVSSFHTDAMVKKEHALLKDLTEADTGEDNDTLQHVTAQSKKENIQWGQLIPQIEGDIQWSLKESNSVYSSILLQYQVKCKGEGENTDIYNVNEFFKIRYYNEKIQILDYDRTMNQIFNGASPVLTEKGIVLGITPSTVQHMSSGEGNIVSFVQERELWTYNKEGDEISLVFSFADSEAKDVRNLYDQHEIKLIEMSKEGNTTFAVYGYMNRGKHEGETGVAIYYYDIAKSVVEEKAFIPSNKSFGIVKQDLGQLVYYSKTENMVYVMLEGKLSKIDLKTGERETLVKNLEEGQYVASDDGHLLAYQTNGSLNEATEVAVLNLSSGKTQEIQAEEVESIRPLGFVLNDFVYGVAKKEDAGETVSGERVDPMYKIEIRDNDNKVAKTYQVDGVYMLDTVIDNNMITLHRATKEGGIYIGTTEDYITNNEKKEDSNIVVDKFSEDPKGTQMRIRYENGIKDKAPKLLKPKQVLLDQPITLEFDSTDESGRFYLYGRGHMLGIYEKVAYAIEAADKVGGVVVTHNQSYVWERGNRDLRSEVEGVEPFEASQGESTLAASLRTLIAREGVAVDATAELEAGKSPAKILSEQVRGETLDLTGCTVEQILYIIGRGTPIIAMTDRDNAILLVGYNTETITYMDPATGKKPSVSPETIEEMTAGSGHTYIGYVK